MSQLPFNNKKKKNAFFLLIKGQFQIHNNYYTDNQPFDSTDICYSFRFCASICMILKSKSIQTKKRRLLFFHLPRPYLFTCRSNIISESSIQSANKGNSSLPGDWLDSLSVSLYTTFDFILNLSLLLPGRCIFLSHFLLISLSWMWRQRRGVSVSLAAGANAVPTRQPGLIIGRAHTHCRNYV